MKRPDDNEWRLRYLRILTGPTCYDYNSREDLQAIEDLAEEELIRGTPVRGAEGIVEAASLVRGADGLAVPTLKGRLFIEDQRAILRRRTPLGRFAAVWPHFSGLAGVFVGWLLASWHPFTQDRQRDSVGTPAARQQNVTPHPTKATPPTPPSTPAATTPAPQTPPKTP